MNRPALATAINSALLTIIGLHSGTAWAQSQSTAGQAALGQDPMEIEEIVVTGIRQSLARSVEAKRIADVVSDVIAAEDIGKFPQQNIAESLQRITGVQITRSKGEGQLVSVRGLDPKFTQVLYNGRQLPAASGSRSFDFTILSADFIRELQIGKTPTADQREGGVAATINVQTARPLDIGKRRAAMRLEGIHESNPDSTQPHLSAFYNDVFADNTFGVALGVDYGKRDLQVERFEAFGFEPGVEANRAPPLDYNVDGDFNDSFAFNHAANYGMDIGERERKSFMAAFQYRPNAAFEGARRCVVFGFRQRYEISGKRASLHQQSRTGGRKLGRCRRGTRFPGLRWGRPSQQCAHGSAVRRAPGARVGRHLRRGRFDG